MSDYSLQLPNELKEQAQEFAAERQVSLNQWLLEAIAQRVEAERVARLLHPYAERLDDSRLSSILSRVPDIEPLPGDELE
jgi:hypothetical protein